MRVTLTLCLLVRLAFASPEALEKAKALYEHTDYATSLRVLNAAASPDAAVSALIGKNHYMLGDFGKAAQFFEKAISLDPRNSEYELWLGRAYGRHAETGGWLAAIPYASKARRHFEKAV